MTTGRINQVTPSSRARGTGADRPHPTHPPSPAKAGRNHLSTSQRGRDPIRERVQTTTHPPSFLNENGGGPGGSERSHSQLGQPSGRPPRLGPTIVGETEGSLDQGNLRCPGALGPQATTEPIPLDRTMARGHSSTRANELRQGCRLLSSKG